MPTRSAKMGGRWWDTRTRSYVSRTRRSGRRTRRESSMRSKVLRMKQALTCGGHPPRTINRDEVGLCMAENCHLRLCDQCASVIVRIQGDTDYYCDKHAKLVEVTYQ